MNALRQALRIDLEQPISVKDRLARRSNYEQPAEQPAETYSERESKRSDPTPILHGCTVTTTDVYSMYPNDQIKASKVILVLKLCLAQLNCGQATVDAEEHAMRVALALGLDSPRLDIGPRRMTASFGNGPTHLLETNRGIIVCKLEDITDLAILISGGFTKDVAAASQLLDEIMEAPLPYGWLVAELLYWALSTMAAICAFFGSYYDMAAVAAITVGVLFVRNIVRVFPNTMRPLELFFVSLVIGLLSAVLWRYALYPKLHEPLCRVSVLILSPLLVYLPGGELTLGTYEIKTGNIIVGASRLVSALVRCMFMGLGLTVGWQFFGHNTLAIHHQNTTKAQASMVPSERCKPFDSSSNTVSPWWLVYGVYNLILLVPVLAGMNVHPRRFLGPYFVAYLSLLLFGGLSFGCSEDKCGLPTYLVNMIGFFFATNLACLREYLTGNPFVSAIIPVLMVKAPGSQAVLQVLALMQSSDGVKEIRVEDDVFTYLVLLGASYALGMFLAIALWRPALAHKQTNLSVRTKRSSMMVVASDRF